MKDLRKAAEMALERLESHEYWMDEEAIKALRQALAQPKQKPVGYVTDSGKSAYILLGVDLEDDTPVYATPPHYWGNVTNAELVEELRRRGMMENLYPGQEPVLAGSLSVRYFRGDKAMTDTYFEYLGDLSEGDYTLYTAPPKREWKSLTSDDKHFLLASAWNKKQAFDGFMDAIDKFLEEKNT